MKTQIHDIPDMDTLRDRIDALDAALIALLGERRLLIDQAARIKRRIGLPARIDARVEEVVANARRHAEDQGLDPDLIERIWRQLIEAAIAQEDAQLAQG